MLELMENDDMQLLKLLLRFIHRLLRIKGLISAGSFCTVHEISWLAYHYLLQPIRVPGSIERRIHVYYVRTRLWR